MLHEIQRAEVAETALGLLTAGLIVNTSGNVSIRVGDHVVITPSGRDYRSLAPRDIAVVDQRSAQPRRDSPGDWNAEQLAPTGVVRPDHPYAPIDIT